MRFTVSGMSFRVGAAAAALAVSVALGSTWAQKAWAQAQIPNKIYVMKVSNSTIKDAPHQYTKDFAAAVERDSGGRIKSQVYPASQLGSIPRQIEGVQFGAIQAMVMPPEFIVGVDERFAVLAAPGLVEFLEHGQRVAADPAAQKLMLGTRRCEGVARCRPHACPTVIRHLENSHSSSRRLQRKEIRVFASQFQTMAFNRLGATPVAMTLGDVLPALQQGAIDGAVAGVGPFVHLHFGDAAKYITETNQPAIFLVLEVSQKWYELAAQGSARDRRPGRRRSVRGARSGGARDVRRAALGMGERWRRAYQPAAR